MPPLTPPGLSPSAAPGEVAFAWSSIRGGTGAAMADCANSLGAGRQVRYVAAVATRTNTPAAACKLMATGRQTASRRSMCSVQQIDDDEKREAGRVESTRSSARGVVWSGPGDRTEKADSNQLSSIGVACVRERACKEACACAAGPGWGTADCSRWWPAAGCFNSLRSLACMHNPDRIADLGLAQHMGGYSLLTNCSSTSLRYDRSSRS
jgi:hypothetical protein